MNIVRKSRPSFTKFPSLVLIGLLLTEIQAFKNVKNLKRNRNIITCRAKLLNADWLRQRAFFLNQEGMIA